MNQILPGKKMFINGNDWNSSTVIASCVYSDGLKEGDEPIWTIILLNDVAPYYVLAQVSGDGPDIYWNKIDTFYNIVNVVDEYQQYGGDI